MTFNELTTEIRSVADKCDESRDQQMVKATLLGLLGAMHSRRHEALMNHVCDFSERELIELQAQGN